MGSQGSSWFPGLQWVPIDTKYYYDLGMPLSYLTLSSNDKVLEYAKCYVHVTDQEVIVVSS